MDTTGARYYNELNFWLRQELSKCKCSSVCLMKTCLEVSIFIFLSQVSLRSVSGQSRVSLRSVPGQPKILCLVFFDLIMNVKLYNIFLWRNSLDPWFKEQRLWSFCVNYTFLWMSLTISNQWICTIFMRYEFSFVAQELLKLI